MSNPRSGHIKLSRKMFDGHDDLWADGTEFDRRSAWTDLIQLAAFRPHRKLVGNVSVDLQRGEFLGSLRFLGDRWKWGRHKVQIFLDMLVEGDRLRAVRGTPKGTIYLIVNYGTYQTGGDTKGDDKGTDRGTGGGQVGDRKGTKRSKDLDLEVQEEQEDQDLQNLEPSDASHRRADLVVQDPLDPFNPPNIARRVNALVAHYVEQFLERPSEADIRKQGAAAKRIAKTRTDEQCARAIHGIGHLMPHSKGEPWDLFDLERKFGKAQQAGQYRNGRVPSPDDPDAIFQRVYEEALGDDR